MLKDAISAARGLKDDSRDAYVSLIRRDGEEERYLMENQLYSELVAGQRQTEEHEAA